ncbi:MAG TPA: type II toxin-antitoxin system HigB family toxin [Candidatus Acidoferrales bacterium]|nr:type II toxin-antitoxin system HigB family toxin [Candidatus Acidoferrales bacterium]
MDEASKAHPDWKASLQIWIRVVSAAQWRHFPDIRQTLGNADLVGPYVIFNIAHNRARLVAVVNYADQRVTLVEILSHADYDREDYTK